MSSFRCGCGNTITDITDFLPYKAYFLPDQDIDDALAKTMEEVAEFIEARERGEQEQYLKEQGLFPHTSTVKDILYHSFSHPTFEFGRSMYECEECGRIWMRARPDKNMLVSYLPESDSRGILRHEGVAPDE
jgi:hypothetical protein